MDGGALEKSGWDKRKEDREIVVVVVIVVAIKIRRVALDAGWGGVNRRAKQGKAWTSCGVTTMPNCNACNTCTTYCECMPIYI